MFGKSLTMRMMLALSNVMSPPLLSTATVPTQAAVGGVSHRPMSARKGQIRNAKPKPSGVAAMKRAATKRNNIRKHKGN